MSGGLVLLGDDLGYLARLAVALRPVCRSTILKVGANPIRETIEGNLGDPLAVIICLTGKENVADVRLAIMSQPNATFLFLSPQAPPRASMAHAIHDCDGAIISMAEEPIIIAATLITLLTGSSKTA